MRKTEIFVILGSFLSFHPPDNAENQSFKIVKNTWRYYHLTHLHHKWQSYDAWFLRYGDILLFWTVFCSFTSLWARKLIFWKNETKPEDIMILQMCTTNGSHMMYGSWDMECNGQNVLSFWTTFLPFYSPNNSKNQYFEKMKKEKKKHLGILSFYTGVP